MTENDVKILNTLFEGSEVEKAVKRVSEIFVIIFRYGLESLSYLHQNLNSLENTKIEANERIPKNRRFKKTSWDLTEESQKTLGIMIGEMIDTFENTTLAVNQEFVREIQIEISTCHRNPYLGSWFVHQFFFKLPYFAAQHFLD